MFKPTTRSENNCDDEFNWYRLSRTRSVTWDQESLFRISRPGRTIVELYYGLIRSINHFHGRRWRKNSAAKFCATGCETARVQGKSPSARKTKTRNPQREREAEIKRSCITFQRFPFLSSFFLHLWFASACMLMLVDPSTNLRPMQWNCAVSVVKLSFWCLFFSWSEILNFRSSQLELVKRIENILKWQIFGSNDDDIFFQFYLNNVLTKLKKMLFKKSIFCFVFFLTIFLFVKIWFYILQFLTKTRI